MNKKQTICLWVGIVAYAMVLLSVQNSKISFLESLGFLYICTIPIVVVTAGLVCIFRGEKESLKPEVKIPWYAIDRINEMKTKEMIVAILIASLVLPILSIIGPIIMAIAFIAFLVIWIISVVSCFFKKNPVIKPLQMAMLLSFLCIFFLLGCILNWFCAGELFPCITLLFGLCCLICIWTFYGVARWIIKPIIHRILKAHSADKGK